VNGLPTEIVELAPNSTQLENVKSRHCPLPFIEKKIRIKKK
jgi:hypothetical protein